MDCPEFSSGWLYFLLRFVALINVRQPGSKCGSAFGSSGSRYEAHGCYQRFRGDMYVRSADLFRFAKKKETEHETSRYYKNSQF